MTTGAWLAVCGHANIDVILDVGAYPGPSVSVPVKRRRVVYGGTAANIARHAGGLGVPTRLWARVGSDFPPAWKAGLEGDGVDLSFMDVVDGALTPTCTILSGPDGEQAFCMDQGPMDHMVDHAPPDSLLGGLAWLHLGTGDPAAYMNIAKAARKAGVRVAFDPAQEIHFAYNAKSFEGLLNRSDVLFVNMHELQVALGFLRYGDAEQLLDHVEQVVVTRGKEGASLYRRGAKRFDVPAVAGVDVVDPTGAGDALRAGWYAALHRGLGSEEALRWGVHAGAAAVRLEGPQPRALQLDELGLNVGP